jgi:hypothetical protein
MAPYVPPEQFCFIFDGVVDNYDGLKFRRAAVPSRLK